MVHAMPAPIDITQCAQFAFLDQSWADQALCAQVDPEMFHPAKGKASRGAKDICLGCPVPAECLDWAQATQQRWGVWGGQSAQERGWDSDGCRQEPVLVIGFSA